MALLQAKDINRISYELLCAGGATSGHARIVADHLASANLVGHDSHGFIRIIEYMNTIKEGGVDPVAQPEVVQDSKSMAIINGHNTFGQVVFTKAQELAVEKARQFGMGLVTMRNHSHTGRLGHYAEKIAECGMAAIMWTGYLNTVNCGDSAPFGGKEARLGTNPIAMAFPHSSGEAVLLDFATTIAAEGKIRVFRAKGMELPAEWILTSEGKPSKNPDDFYEGGSIFPMGGVSGGHKGYALAFMASLFGGVLSQLGEAVPGKLPDLWCGSSILAIDLANIAPINTIHEQVAGTIKAVKSSPTVEGVKEILYPGEIESNTRRKRKEAGIEVEEATWQQVLGLIKKHGLEKVLDGVG